MSRGRVNASSTVPETGSSRASCNVIVTWDPAADPRDVEESIKAAARQAIRRFRQDSGHRTDHVAGQLALPLGT